MIETFTNGYVFLSNFYPCKICFHGLEFSSAEHLYQWHKAIDPYEREIIRSLRTPGQAKRYSMKVAILPDWDEVRTGIMLMVVLEKFRQNTDIAKLLLGTSPHLLVEGNKWGDQYWGKIFTNEGTWVGQNHLGRILMTVRDYLLLGNP